LNSRQFFRSGLSKQRVAALAAARCSSYVDFLDGFMNAIASESDRHRWVEKSPNNAYFVDQIAAYYPDARFIHVIRDGRSVAASQRQLGWGRKYARNVRHQLVWIGSVWALHVNAGRRAATFGNGRYLEIRYEDIIEWPAGTLERIGAFAGVDLNLDTVAGSSVGALGDSNTAFTLDSGGIADGALRRWRTTLEAEEIALLDWQLGDLLHDLGYAVGNDVPLARLRDRAVASVSRLALDSKRLLNFHTPVGRFARVPLEVGLP
jgi:hypothetical protein